MADDKNSKQENKELAALKAFAGGMYALCVKFPIRTLGLIGNGIKTVGHVLNAGAEKVRSAEAQIKDKAEVENANVDNAIKASGEARDTKKSENESTTQTKIDTEQQNITAEEQNKRSKMEADSAEYVQQQTEQEADNASRTSAAADETTAMLEEIKNDRQEIAKQIQKQLIERKEANQHELHAHLDQQEINQDNAKTRGDKDVASLQTNTFIKTVRAYVKAEKAIQQSKRETNQAEQDARVSTAQAQDAAAEIQFSAGMFKSKIDVNSAKHTAQTNIDKHQTTALKQMSKEVTELKSIANKMATEIPKENREEILNQLPEGSVERQNAEKLFERADADTARQQKPDEPEVTGTANLNR